jgi:hypothetical protein
MQKPKLIIILLTAANLAYSQQTFYVSVNGNDANNGLQQSPFRTIAKALTASSAGGEIIVRAGTYNEALRVEKQNITIKAFTGEKPIISTTTNTGSPDQTIWFLAKGGKLQGLEITGGFYYAVKFETGDALITGCKIHDTGRDCVKIVPGANNIRIESCEIYNSGIRDNSNAEGIDNVNGDDFVLLETYIHHTATTGVYVKGGGRRCLIERNLITNTGNAGIMLGFFTDAEFYNDDNDPDTNPEYYGNIDGIVRNNIIIDAQGPGIGLFASFNSKVYNNTLIRVALAQRGGIHFEPLNDDNAGLPTPVTNAFVVNNIAVSTSTRPLVEIRKFDNTNGTAGTTTINNNLYYHTAGSPVFNFNGTGGQAFAQWKTNTGFDAASILTNPQLDNHYHLTATSAAVNAGQTVSANTNDYDHGVRVAPFDIGADEFGTNCVNTTVPPPAGIIGTGQSCTITSLNEFPLNNITGIYPVPAQNRLWLKDASDINRITITDITGRRILEKQLTGNMIDMHFLKDGVYFLNITYKNGQKATKQFVVVR